MARRRYRPNDPSRLNSDQIVELDRGLSAFMANLRRRGIYARKAYLCCGSCGHYAAGDHITQPANAHYRGYVFYHRQEAARLREGSRFAHLQWSIRDGEDAPAVVAAFGDEVRQAAVEAGLAFEWGGTPEEVFRVGYDLAGHLRATALPEAKQALEHARRMRVQARTALDEFQVTIESCEQVEYEMERTGDQHMRSWVYWVRQVQYQEARVASLEHQIAEASGELTPTNPA